MTRVKRSVSGQAKRRKALGEAKGYWGLKKSSYRRAKEQLLKSGTYAYRDRRVRKREFRKLWIMRINAGARQHGLSYSQLIHGLREANIEVDRKMLADLAAREPEVFAQMAAKAKEALAAG
jgi:large subunit ribosomal protein L20